jgi:hemerythrin-like domain-containing protein
METETLAAALEREHHEIDRGVEAFLADPDETAPLTAAMEALRRHIFLEEEFLFPPLRDAGLFAPIFVMLREHGEIWRTMRELDEGLAAGADVDALTGVCRTLLTQLERHNAKEEPIIYPQADSELTPIARASLHAFLKTAPPAPMPDGWVCTGAQT